MKKRAWFSYFILALLCFALINFRFSFIENLRGPFFGFEELFAFTSIDSKTIEIAELKTENMQLKKQIQEIKAYLSSEDSIEDIYKKCKEYDQADESMHSSFCKRKLEQMIDFLNLSKWHITANVIYREPANWSSAIWIDVGYAKNKFFKKNIVAIDSPVVLGDHLIGVVEKVDKYKSLVRLITDSRVSPSVRCVRGREQTTFINNQCQQLKELLLLYPESEYNYLVSALEKQIKRFSIEGNSNYFAKGYLMGSSHPIWRSRSLTLQGVGFNYDYGDEEGPPRFLYESNDAPLFQKGDALLTTGMDGVFPPNLLVAFVTEVAPLKEGAVSCELKAKIALPEFSDLRRVTVLPPVSILK